MDISLFGSIILFGYENFKNYRTINKFNIPPLIEKLKDYKAEFLE